MKLTSPLATFMFASIGLHAGVLVMSNSTNITLPGSTGSVMAVKIKEATQQLTENKKSQAKTKLMEKHPDRKTISSLNQSLNKTDFISKAKNKKTTKNHTSKEDLDKKLTTLSSDTRQSESRARIVSIIHKELSQHFTYPKLAQRRNWQGKVMLTLRVTSTGKLEDIQLNSSSGYSILDQAAIASLSKLGHLPQVSSWLPYDININLPVIYLLTSG